MINKSVKYSYRGVNKDITKSKHPFEYYYDAQHIRILSTNDQSTGSVTNEKGNELIITLPNISINTSSNTITYGSSNLIYTNGNEIDTQISDGILPLVSNNQHILNITNTRDGLVVFSTDVNNTDCIWNIPNFVNEDYTLELLYIRNLNFNLNNPIQSIYNYENENIQKIYWVDGLNQIRFININNDSLDTNDKLIDLPSNNINFVGNINFTQPIITDVVGGGTHTSGMIQYAYNLYRKNGSQTKLSPFSELVALDKGDNKGGGDVNEVVGAVPIITINDLDTSYTNIKIYAIKYTSYNQIPSISLIEESEISGNGITVYDNGDIIESLSLEEFLFLGSDPIIPKHINTKDNRLFPANIKDKPFVLPDELDFRAYSFPINSALTFVYDRVGNSDTGYSITPTNYNLDKTNDAINKFMSVRRYLPNSSIIGGEGKYLKYQILQQSVDSPEDKKFFKDREIYRIGIELYNNLGQTSLPQWVGDIQVGEGNLQGQYNILRVDLKPEFYTFINNYTFDSEEDKPVGYRILRAERNGFDRTIISQGVITPMMFQVIGEEVKDWEKFKSRLIREQKQDSNLKIPSYLSRTLQRIPTDSQNGALNKIDHLGWLNDRSGLAIEEGGEIFSATKNDFKISQTFQYTKMFQMYSPDVIFDQGINYSTDLKLRVIGQSVNTANGIFAEERNISSKATVKGGRSLGGVNPWYIDENDYIEDNSFKDTFGTGNESNGTNRRALVAFSGSEQTMDFKQWYRQYNNFVNDTTKKEYDILGTPEISENGDDPSFYNNDPRYNYSNSLQSFVSDGSDDNDSGRFDPLQSINSWAARTTTIVLGVPENTTDQRKSYEDLFNESSLSNTNGILNVEITKDISQIYNSSIYGGFSYEDKKRTSYIQIGDYKDIDTTFVQIDSPGDTFVGNFKFLRISKTDTEVYSNSQIQLTEIVEFPVETSVDLKNRNDISLTNWDSRFQPRYDEYHKYNRVYSQESNLVKNTDIDFNFDLVKNFDTRVQSTKLKIPNEIIDSWTDILPNETMDLDGKFGPINNIVEYRDELYTFQDEAIARLSINPRIQISGNDGAQIELGRGGILYDYNYLTTRSGSINKWGIKAAKRGIYYYDALNKGIGRVPDSVDILLSDKKGLHSEFATNYNYSLLQRDNPILNVGMRVGHDNYNNDLYFTFYLGNDNSFTRVFNESIDEFIDLKTYLPRIYHYKGDKFMSTNGVNQIYLHGEGEYNNFYGVYQPSYIILQLNPESNIDTVFNTIQYNSEIYLNDIDQPDKTLTHIEAYNEYQDSGRIPLVVGRTSNLRRKFREWQAVIPRDRRNRIRNPWIFLKLELENTSNYRMILHDIIINYSI